MKRCLFLVFGSRKTAPWKTAPYGTSPEKIPYTPENTPPTLKESSPHEKNAPTSIHAHICMSCYTETISAAKPASCDGGKTS